MRGLENYDSVVRRQYTDLWGLGMRTEQSLKDCDICREILNDGVILSFPIDFPRKWNEARGNPAFRDANMHTRCAKKYIALQGDEMRLMLMKLYIRLRRFNGLDD